MFLERCLLPRQFLLWLSVLTAVPGGIWAVTKSDNLQIAALIQAHVSNMYDRVNQQRSMPMIGMSSTLPTMLCSANQYQRQLHLTPKGIEVIETATNPQMVNVIRDHAQEVTRFVTEGMPAMKNGRMR
jgi:hypothetical protein